MPKRKPGLIGNGGRTIDRAARPEIGDEQVRRHLGGGTRFRDDTISAAPPALIRRFQSIAESAAVNRCCEQQSGSLPSQATWIGFSPGSVLEERLQPP
jgi:hypothetical protein